MEVIVDGLTTQLPSHQGLTKRTRAHFGTRTAGFHLAYIDVQNMYGAPIAMRHMDGFYGQLTETFGLATQCVLEGFSRGALFALNWAALNPQFVACLYLDAPVCDFKSWPGGRGKGKGSEDDWQRLKQVYGFTDDEALAYPFNPVDNLAPIAAAGIPIIAGFAPGGKHFAAADAVSSGGSESAVDIYTVSSHAAISSFHVTLPK